MTSPLLDVRDLHVAYGKLQVLRGVTLHVDAGEAVALLGTNGAGKSTLLKAVSGVLPVGSGSVVVDGVDLTGADARRVLEAGIVHVPGGRATFPHLTVAESLRVACWPFRSDKGRIAVGLDRVYDAFPILASRGDQAAGTLSGGEQQMLALARGLLHDPRLLVVDELSLGLAPAVTGQLLDIVDAIRSTGVALLLVDQRLATAIEATDRAYFLERGQVRFDGPTADLADRGDLVRSVFLSGAGS